jgi:hypothetical protein
MHHYKVLNYLELYNSKASVAGCIFYNKLSNNIKQIEKKASLQGKWRSYLLRGATTQ